MENHSTATSWDVGAWAFGPAHPYRINSLFRLDGAVVTVTGRVETPDAAADLAAALHVFEPLETPLFLDLCHATLDERAAHAVVDAGYRRERATGGPLLVRHAEPVTQARLRDAGSRPLAVPTSLARGGGRDLHR